MRPDNCGYNLTEPPPDIVFAHRVFVFTGKFLFGSRARCVEAATALGGIWDKDVSRRTDYLVIGSMGSRDWAQSESGLKIQKAMHLAAKYGEIAIVTEEHWVGFVDKCLARSGFR